MDHYEFNTLSGDRVAGAIASAGSDVPPLSVVTINGQIVDVRFVGLPQ